MIGGRERPTGFGLLPSISRRGTPPQCETQERIPDGRWAPAKKATARPSPSLCSHFHYTLQPDTCHLQSTPFPTQNTRSIPAATKRARFRGADPTAQPHFRQNRPREELTTTFQQPNRSSHPRSARNTTPPRHPLACPRNAQTRSATPQQVKQSTPTWLPQYSLP